MNVKVKIIKLLEGNVWQYLHDQVVRKDFLVRTKTEKSQNIKKIVDYTSSKLKTATQKILSRKWEVTHRVQGHTCTTCI